MKRFNHYKNKLGSDSVSNPINFADAELLTKLKVENECLKNQIRNLLKLRCANRLKKRSVKQIHKSHAVNDDDKLTKLAAHALLLLGKNC